MALHWEELSADGETMIRKVEKFCQAGRGLPSYGSHRRQFHPEDDGDEVSNIAAAVRPAFDQRSYTVQ